MKVGRNDPCHCGSGKKYKHCCMLAAAVSASAPPELLWRRLRTSLEGLPQRMMAFVEQTYGAVAVDEAFDEFRLDRGLDLENDAPLLQIFMPWFFHFWEPGFATQVLNEALHEVPPTAAYIAQRRRSLDPLLVRYLESCLHTPISFYDVVRCVPGERMILRDILTGDEHEVFERKASSVHRPGDIVLAQLATVDNLTVIESYGGFAIDPQEKARIIRLRPLMLEANERITAELVRDFVYEVLEVFLDIYEQAFHRQLPELQNTDGEAFSMRTLVYDLAVPPQAAFDALKHLALDEPEAALLLDAVRDAQGQLQRVSFTWKKGGNAANPDWQNTILGHVTIDGARLAAEVNSEARADRFADIVEAALGDGAEFRVTRVVSAEEAMTKVRARAASGASKERTDLDDLNERPEVKAKLAQLNAAHYERWIDLPLPLLDARTPREAVENADGREVVAALLMQFERDAERIGSPIDPTVFARLRERLGVPRDES